MFLCGYKIFPNTGKSTTDQIFIKHQLLENTHETQVAHHLFVDYKAAFDSTIRDCVFPALSELGIPAKLIWLSRMTLSNSGSFVKVGMDFSEPIDIVRGIR